MNEVADRPRPRPGPLRVAPPPPARDADRILRFRAAERWVHWSIAIPFMVCFSTALVLVLAYNPDPTRPYRAVFSWIHRISGVA